MKQFHILVTLLTIVFHRYISSIRRQKTLLPLDDYRYFSLLFLQTHIAHYIRSKDTSKICQHRDKYDYVDKPC